MDILGLIPARGGSKGIPGKNVKALGGKPLISHTFASAKACHRLSRLVVSTDSHEIAALAHDNGVGVPFMRPVELAADHSPAVDYVRHCLDYLKTNESYEPSLVVILQPTCPFRSGDDIDACVDMLLRSDADSVVSVAALPSKYHPNWQFTVSGDGVLQPVTGGAWRDLRSARQQLAQTYTRNGAVYAFRTASFLRSGDIYGEKVLAYMMPENRSINIDDLDDWRRAEAAIAGIQNGIAK